MISGPVALAAPAGAELVRVTTGEEMFAAASAHFAQCDVFVMCAAVCDYKPAHYAAQKTKKERGPFSLALEPTRDILSSLTSDPHDCFVVGFAAETQELRTNAQRKLRRKIATCWWRMMSRETTSEWIPTRTSCRFFRKTAPKKNFRAKKKPSSRALC